MLNINNYIIEKLKIDKNTKINWYNEDDLTEAVINYLTGTLHYEYNKDYKFKIWKNPDLKYDKSIEISIDLLSKVMQPSSSYDLNNFAKFIKENLEKNFKDYKFNLRLDFREQNIGIAVIYGKN